MFVPMPQRPHGLAALMAHALRACAAWIVDAIGFSVFLREFALDAVCNMAYTDGRRWGGWRVLHGMALCEGCRVKSCLFGV